MSTHLDMFKHFIKTINKRNAEWKLNILLPYIKNSEKVLDFGCGDLSFARALKRQFKKLMITGVDVVDFKEETKEVAFVAYAGKRLPFKDNSFDTVISFYVFHHCKDPQYAFRECLRVAKNRVIFVEAVWRIPFEIMFMRFLDIFFNSIKSLEIHPPTAFYSLEEWKEIINRHKGKIKSIKKMKQNYLPADVSVGVPYIFEITK